MARINIEDSFWVEVVPLVLAMSNQDRAIGHAIRWFRFAQDKHRLGQVVTEADFSKHGFTEALIPIFAERVEGGIRCAGAQKHFSWLNQKIEAGRRGGRSKSEAKTKHLKQNRPKRTVTKGSETEPSYSYSYSYSSSSSPSSSISLVTNASDFIAAYCDRFKLRWGNSPPIQGKDAGIVKRLMKTQSLEMFSTYLDAFFSMPDAYLVKAKHPLNLFEMKLNEIAVFAKSGKFTTTREAHHADNMATNAMLLKKVQNGEIS